MKEHFKESVFPHTRELSIYTECESTEASGVHISNACPHVKSRVHHIGPGGNILMISLPLNTWSTWYFCSLIWREHLDSWWALSILGCGKIPTKSGVLPKRIYPTRTNWNPSFASVWCSWKKKCCQAHKLQTALWGVFEAGVPGLRAGSKHWKLWQQKGGSRLKTLSD